ncbi:MAG: DUF3011 domain-containing protein [Acidobacteriota bacterium]|nr:DUF3011 domain-containing protein [Acidobacteriota bacterium]
MKSLFLLCIVTSLAGAQVTIIDAGASISVRTNQTIDARQSDGRVFTGVVDQDVRDSNGNIAISRGAEVELIVRSVSSNDVVLDLESVTTGGRRYSLAADADIGSGQRNGLGRNARTGEYVGGGALLGTIIGAIAGGGRGAAIGAGAGAAAGAGTQVLTRGGYVNIPAESVVTFRLEQPLQLTSVHNGYDRGGQHYHGEDQSNRSQTITCSSNNGRRVHCNADTRGGVQMVRQLSGSRCSEGSSWGSDAQGVWVDRGCRAEFQTGTNNADRNRDRSGTSTVTCSSDNGQRVYCNAGNQGGVRLVRQLSGSACTEGATWGYDARGIWVDRGCRAEFEVR